MAHYVCSKSKCVCKSRGPSSALQATCPCLLVKIPYNAANAIFAQHSAFILIQENYSCNFLELPKLLDPILHFFSVESLSFLCSALI